LRRPPFKILFLATTGVVPAFADLACTSSSSSTSLDPPHLTASITAIGVTSKAADGTQNCDQVVAVNVGPNDGAGHLKSPSNPPVIWTMSPPQTCVGTPPCGFLELTVSPCATADPTTCSTQTADQQVIDSAGPSITVTVASKVATPFDQFYRFQVELHNQDATLAVDHSGKTYPADIIAEVNAPCAPPAPPPADAASPMRDASADVSKPHMDASNPTRPPDATTLPPTDATTPMDASRPVRDSAPPDAPLPPSPDAARPHDAGRLLDAHTP
jgi:hypothetical protein